MLPLLPVILGGTLTETKSRLRPLLILLSLASSIALFTLLLRASTALIFIDPAVWNILSGSIIFGFGLITLWPNLWEAVDARLRLGNFSAQWLQRSQNSQGVWGPILLGSAMGPVFTSCSPTYALIVAVILPQDFGTGIINLLAYITGIIVIFGAIALGGQRLLKNVRGISNPNGIFKRSLGVIFIILGLLIATGLEKKLESALLDLGFASGLIQVETQIMQQITE
ncbi:MAG: hypothetical protein JNK26_03600 [Candidatus Doudnabacteria bacterium]|nr:hypothetical protein [Candidatus Doudnabacteria bacterium]